MKLILYRVLESVPLGVCCFIFLSAPQQDFNRFVKVLEETRKKTIKCRICFNFSEEEVCDICNSQKRDASVLCVVERPQDVFALEAAHSFFGHYHVLGGVISPMKGIEPSHIKVKELKDRVDAGNFKEVILALNSTIESEATRLFIRELLDSQVSISELSRGMPAGGELEYVDRGTIQRAIEERRIQ